MPRPIKLEKHQIHLLKSLAKEHASNKIIRRQVQRGITAVGRRAKKYVKSGALGRDIRRYGPALLAGMGDYHVKSRSHRDGGAMPRYKKHSGLEKGEMCISHSEYIGELISGVGAANANTPFTSQNYGINAGNSGTFPWLSTVAASFQNYRFKKLIFEFRPLCPDNVSSATGALTSLGTVMAATQYDSVIGPYLNKTQMENSDFSASCKPSEHLMHPVECNPKYNPLGEYYVSPNVGITTLSANGSVTNDVRFQNVGIFQIASVGQPSGTGGTPGIDLGEIWVHYEVDLYKPTIYGSLVAELSAHYQSSNSTPANATMLGSAAYGAVANNALPLTFNLANSQFFWPLAVTEGQFLVCIKYVSQAGNITSTGAVTLAPVTAGTITFTTPWGSGSSFAPSVSSATNTSAEIMFLANINAPGSVLAGVTVTAAGWTFTGNAVIDIIVTPYNLLMQ